MTTCTLRCRPRPWRQVGSDGVLLDCRDVRVRVHVRSCRSRECWNRPVSQRTACSALPGAASLRRCCQMPCLAVWWRDMQTHARDKRIARLHGTWGGQRDSSPSLQHAAHKRAILFLGAGALDEWVLRSIQGRVSGQSRAALEKRAHAPSAAGQCCRASPAAQRGREHRTSASVRQSRTFTSMQRARKCWKCLLQRAGFFSCGVPCVVISSSACHQAGASAEAAGSAGCVGGRTRSGGSRIKGGSPSAISSAVMPNDHTSTFAPYARPRISSERQQHGQRAPSSLPTPRVPGAIQYGVPTTLRRLSSSSVSPMANPKSAADRAGEVRAASREQGAGHAGTHPA